MENQELINKPCYEIEKILCPSHRQTLHPVISQTGAVRDVSAYSFKGRDATGLWVVVA
jgi:hypothetical protein